MAMFDWMQAASRPVLHGDGIVLRLPLAEDFEEWRDLRSASRDFLLPWEPAWPSDELSRESFRLRLRRYRRDARDRSGYAFFILDAGSEAILGGVTLGRIQRGVAQSATIGYWMGAVHAGKGVMYRALDALMTFAFEVECLHRLEAACLPTNARSIRLLEKSGFRREGYLRSYLKIAGTWEDHRLYAILAEDRAEASRARGK